MKSLIGVSLFIIASIVLVEGQQRVAPGVPPQQYQQQYAPPSSQQMQPPQQQVPNQAPQMQQQVPQYQQQPMQQQAPQQHMQQQAPQQHMQQQVPVQGVPQHGASHGAHGHQQQQLLNTANIMHEKDHIQEHIDIPMDISKMSEQELQFHYFKMHDADRNDKLDGCELIKSLIHWHGESNPTPDVEGQKTHTDEELQSLVDSILDEMDKNNDGFVDFVEYKSASN